VIISGEIGEERIMGENNGRITGENNGRRMGEEEL
jgi:hypothetical protein